MASYVVMAPPEGDPEGTETRFVRDGFAFFALVLPFMWFLWHRLWLWALAFLGLAVASHLLMSADGWDAAGLAMWLAASLLAGLEGQNMRIRYWERRGWICEAVLEAGDAASAEAIYFESSRRARPAAPSAAAMAPPPPRDDGTFGLFEWNAGR